MEPPAVLSQDGSNFRTAKPTRDCEGPTLVATVARSDGAGVVQIEAHGHIQLVPKVRRFFEAYLAADDVNRADLRKAAAYASHQFRFDPPETPSIQDDLAAAIAIAQKAANIAYANDLGQMIEGSGLGFVDSALLANAYATLALGYRYIAGFDATDPLLSDLGEAAVRLVLLAEREYDSALSVSSVNAASSAPTSDAFGSNEELPSTLLIFEPPAADQNEKVASSLAAISRRLKGEILLMA
jgi:hypothetical protein